MPRSRLPFVRLAVVAAAVAMLVVCRAGPPARSLPAPPELDATMHHLGNDRTPEWTEAPAEPEKAPLAIPFASHANAREWLLELSTRDVDDDWTVELNGLRLGRLARKSGKEVAIDRLVVPAGSVHEGENTLRFVPRDPNEDITVGRVRLLEQELRDVLALGRVEVSVSDAATRSPLPARVTVVDANGKLAPLYYAERPQTAVRAGVAYTSDGVAAIELPAGHYAIWVSRGMEWSCHHAEVDVAVKSRQSIVCSLAREVDTRGWIAADTHMHTLTWSGHGDSSVEERVVTLAGEGIELAVATDHNHQTDYRPQQAQLGLNSYFTPVAGNEVTTDNGHMNAFPLTPNGDVPPYKESDWAKLVDGIRAKGAKVVILNHPRWPEGGRDPLTSFGFDDLSGERKNGQRFTFDCVELVNSDAPTQPFDVVLPGWYGLLNRGERFTGVGASDSHHVGVIVGQGRTYVPSATDDPAKIDVDAACREFKAGHVTVSYGMLATLDVEGCRMGDTLVLEHAGERDPARERDDIVQALVQVSHPSWVTPEKLELVVDGKVVATASLAPAAGDSATRLERRVYVKLPPHDSWVVAVATGAKVTAPFWAMSQPRAVAVTNPVFVDRDGEPGWQSPRATAERLLGRASRDAEGPAQLEERLPAELARVDDAVAIQLLELARDDLRRTAQAKLESLAASAGEGRAALRAWAAAQRSPR